MKTECRSPIDAARTGAGRTRALRLVLVLGALGLGALWCASGAFAADTLYWANGRVTLNQPGGSGISSANLDGSGGGQDLTTTGAQVNGPGGTAIDSATGRIYWPNSQADTISWASLDGSGGGNLSTAGAEVDLPLGVSIDPTARKIYWANVLGGSGTGSISWANLDGSGGGNLNTTGATLDAPAAVVVNPADGRIYWANEDNISDGGGGISWAALDGSGGGNLTPPQAATVYSPSGVAIDGATNTIYWTNFNGTISYDSLTTPSSGGTLDTTGAGTVNAPEGLAIDPTAGKLYWGNFGGQPTNSIAYANLNGSGGGTFDTTGATNRGDSFPSLLKAPQAIGVPTITRSSSSAALSCSQGWAADHVESFLYQAPHTISYEWKLNGSTITGASSASYTPTSSGEYTCTVAGANQAGTTAPQTSDPRSVLALGVSKSGSGAGTVTSSPGGISCGSTCSATFVSGTTVKLTAIPLPDSRFTGWSGACSGTGACAVTMNAEKTVTAAFTLVPPDTTITKQSVSQEARSATFRFKASGPTTGFRCALVKSGSGAPSFASCASPKTYQHLTPGSYTFRVRALDAAGPDPTPATATFKLLAVPSTRITQHKILKDVGTARFGFAADGPVKGFGCALVRPHQSASKPSFSSCLSPKVYKHLKPGSYTFLVRASNAAGFDRSPAKFKFTI
jgi:hypothetical protein